MKLHELSPLQQAQTTFSQHVLMRSVSFSTVKLNDACGRTVYESVVAPVDMPPYARAIVEGYLVKAKATQGANEDQPRTFTVVGAIQPGDESYPDFADDQALSVVTGSIVPNEGYAIVRMWEAKQQDGDSFAVEREFPENFFIETQGCDLQKGSEVIAAGVDIGPWEIALLASLGILEVKVCNKPKVAIFASGNEVIAPEEEMRPGMIRDCNSVMLSAAVTQAGGQAKQYGIIRDDFDYFLAELKKALSESDVIVITGGTAVEGRDFVSDLIREVGTLVIDGVQMRSGRPLIMGVADGKPIVCVAGHPPEALRGFKLFGVAAINRILGRDLPIPEDN